MAHAKAQRQQGREVSRTERPCGWGSQNKEKRKGALRAKVRILNFILRFEFILRLKYKYES